MIFMKKILVIFLSFFVFLIILEIFLRLFGYFFVLNNQKTAYVLKENNVYRIMCLGDSTTALGGVDSYPYILEEVLNNSYSKIKFEVINKGEILVDTEHIANNLESNIYKYNPNLIIVMAGINDKYKMAFGAWTKPNFLFNNFKIYRFLVMIFENIKQKQQIKEKDKNIDYELRILESIKKDETNLQNYLELGTYYKNLGKFDKAVDYFNKAADRVKDNYIPYYLLGLTYYGNKNYNKGIEMLKKSIELNPKHVNSYMNLGFCYKEQSEFLKAAEILELGLKINQRNYELYSEIGFCCKELKMYDKAEVMLLKSIKYLPLYFWAYAELVDVYKKNQENNKAKKILSDYIKIQPYDDKAYRKLSEIYYLEGNFKYAEDLKKKANHLNVTKYQMLTKNNFLRIKETADKFGIKIIFMQYPLRSVVPLKSIFENNSVEIVDNEQNFKSAININGFSHYFVDIFAGDFGHCSREGNKLIAENLKNTILKDNFQ